MTQNSLFHAGNTVGDAVNAPYSAGNWNDFFWWFFTGKTQFADDADVHMQDGVIPNYLNGLATSLPGGATGGLVRVAQGAAIVGGALYINDSTVDIPVAAPVSGTNFYIIALKKDITAQTVRAVALGPTSSLWPSLAGFSWDASSETEYLGLQTVTVTSVAGGTISLVNDIRRYVNSGDYRSVIMSKRQGEDSIYVCNPGTTNIDVEDNGWIVFGTADITITNGVNFLSFSQLVQHVNTNNGYVFLASVVGTDKANANYVVTTFLSQSTVTNVKYPIVVVKDAVGSATGSLTIYFIVIGVSDENFGTIQAYNSDAFVPAEYEVE
jgi:hypothetical protein